MSETPPPTPAPALANPPARRGRRWVPSPGAIGNALRQGVTRFPIPLSFAFATMGVVLLALPENPGLERVVPLGLGISTFFALRLAGETGVLGRRIEIAVSIALALGLLWLHGAWDAWTQVEKGVRGAQLFLSAHLLVAVLPFLGTQENAGAAERFRPFNRQLLLRLVEGVAQAGILFVGISAALLAVDRLFGISVADLTYARLGVVLYLGFLPTHLASGFPNPVTIDPDVDPRVLRVLGRWVLLPLATLYLLILSAYFIQVLVTRAWPSGWIGWLVSWMAVVGILTVLLVRPRAPDSSDRGPDPAAHAPGSSEGAGLGVGEHSTWANTRWLLLWERGFWALMVLASGMLLSALWKRVGQYGVTETRYFGMVLGAWLGVMAVLYVTRRGRDLRWIPGSLLVLAFLSTMGPWGALEVSRQSQFGRLEAIRERVAEAGSRDAVLERDRVEVREVLDYLFRVHPEAVIPGVSTETRVSTEASGAEALSEDDASGEWGEGRRAQVERVALSLGVDPPVEGSRFDDRPRGERWVQLDRSAPVPLAGFSNLIAVQGGDDWRGEVAGVQVRAVLGPEPLVFRLVPVADASDRTGWSFDLSSFAATLDGARTEGYWTYVDPSQARVTGVWTGAWTGVGASPVEVVLIPVDLRFFTEASGQLRLTTLVEGWILVPPL